MELATDFKRFLQDIRLTENQKVDAITGHQTLRARLNQAEDLDGILVSTFLQGSYRRHTAVRPMGDRRADVDVVVVTRLAETDYTPGQAMALFEPFLQKWYKGKWRRQGRSMGIDLSYVELDLVITSAPALSEMRILRSDAVTTSADIVEAQDWRLHPAWLSLENRAVRRDASQLLLAAKSEDEWKSAPLRIPDRESNAWDDTHPLEQIRWTRDKNARTGGHFVNVVRSLKWWRLVNYEKPENPKGFPFERIVGETCPDGIESVAQGMVDTLEAIVARYASFAAAGTKPRLPDYGVSAHDVLHRLSADDFGEFWKQASESAHLARAAYESSDREESGNLWRRLLGSKFPLPPDDNGGGGRGYTEPTAPAVPGAGRFA